MKPLWAPDRILARYGDAPPVRFQIRDCPGALIWLAGEMTRRRP